MSPEAERGVKVRRGYRDLLAERLRCWRTEKQLTLKAIASDLGVSISLVKDWETGRRFPCAENLENLAKYMHLKPCRLFCVPSRTCRTNCCRGTPA